MTHHIVSAPRQQRADNYVDTWLSNKLWFTANVIGHQGVSSTNQHRRRKTVEGPKVISIPDGDELFTDEASAVSLIEDQESDQSWVEFAVAVKPTGGRDARNKKKE